MAFVGALCGWSEVECAGVEGAGGCAHNTKMENKSYSRALLLNARRIPTLYDTERTNSLVQKVFNLQLNVRFFLLICYCCKNCLKKGNDCNCPYIDHLRREPPAHGRFFCFT